MQHDSINGVPLSFVDLMACGLGAMVLLLFTALLPLGNEAGTSAAVAAVVLTLHYDTATDPQPGLIIEADFGPQSKLEVRADEGVKLGGHEQAALRATQLGTVWLSAPDEEPEVVVSWTPPELQGNDRKWQWFLTVTHHRRTVPVDVRFEVLPEMLRPKSLTVSMRMTNGSADEDRLISVPSTGPIAGTFRIGREFEVSVVGAN